MSRLRVEKRPVEADLLLSDGSILTGSLFLAPLSPTHVGLQTVPDLMAEDVPLLPFRRTDGGFLLVGKSSVAGVRLQGEPPAPEELLTPVRVTVHLTGGHVIDGHMMAEQGAGDRLSSLLNISDPWARIDAGGAVHWVYRRALVTVEPREG